MDVSSNYNLIPYPDHNYQIEPYVQENSVANHDPGQESIERHNRFQRPHSDIKVDTIHFDVPGDRYDASRCFQYSDADRVGVLVDIYA